LPPHWHTLYDLTRLDDETFAQKIADKTIRPDLPRSEIAGILRHQRQILARGAYMARIAEGCTVGDLHRLGASGYKAGAILADPPWRYGTWSDKGRDRSPDRHYDTEPLAGIKALPVPELAARDCALFLWCVDWLLPGAFDVLAAWGFTFIKIAFVWVKQNASGEGLPCGMGKWTRAGAEMCLLATRGNPKRLAADVHQVIVAPAAEHSRKPDEAHDRIERLVGGPYLELYARRERIGWTTWGNELPCVAQSRLASACVAPIEAVHAMPAQSSAGDELLVIPNFLRRGHPDCPVGASG
jgi:N6-adenosine-specific RNA methylase IME4